MDALGLDRDGAEDARRCRAVLEHALHELGVHACAEAVWVAVDAGFGLERVRLELSTAGKRQGDRRGERAAERRRRTHSMSGLSRAMPELMYCGAWTARGGGEGGQRGAREAQQSRRSRDDRETSGTHCACRQSPAGPTHPLPGRRLALAPLDPPRPGSGPPWTALYRPRRGARCSHAGRRLRTGTCAIRTRLSSRDRDG